MTLRRGLSVTVSLSLSGVRKYIPINRILVAVAQHSSLF